MSMKIEQERIDTGDLTKEEIIYLQDRGQLPPNVKGYVRDPFSGEAYEDQSDGWDVVKNFSSEELKEFYRRKKSEEENGPPRIGDKGGVVEVRGEGAPEGDDYDTWTTEELRDSLKENELVSKGNKQELIDRLRRFDNDQLTAEDRAS